MASDIFSTYCDKNHPSLPVLSANQEYGMVIREEIGYCVQHNKENEEGYKRVLPGQFVIHLRSFQGGFAHSSLEGITSPAYTIIKFVEPLKHHDLFWKQIFTSMAFIKSLEVVTYGIRDGRSINFSDYGTLKHIYPEKEEQESIANIFTQIDGYIQKSEKFLLKTRSIKQALLQKMFV